MKKDYMLSYVLKFCKKNSLDLIYFDTGVYCVKQRSPDDDFFRFSGTAYFPSLTKLYYAIQYGDIRSFGYRHLIASTQIGRVNATSFHS